MASLVKCDNCEKQINPRIENYIEVCLDGGAGLRLMDDPNPKQFCTNRCVGEYYTGRAPDGKG